MTITHKSNWGHADLMTCKSTSMADDVGIVCSSAAQRNARSLSNMALNLLTLGLLPVARFGRAGAGAGARKEGSSAISSSDMAPTHGRRQPKMCEKIWLEMKLS